MYRIKNHHRLAASNDREPTAWPRRTGIAGVITLALAFSPFWLHAQQAQAQLQLSPELVASADEAEILPPELATPDQFPTSSGNSQVFSEGDSILSDMDLHDEHVQMVPEGESNLISSGTWFRRGYWYVQEDVVIYTMDLEKDLGLAVDTPNLVTPRQVFVIKGSTPGVAANGRLTLGRFLYRDAKNRDHTAEFSFTGLGKWSAAGDIRSADNTNSLRTLLVTSVPGFFPVAPGFEGTARQDFIYDSRMNNYEWNYRIRRRLRPDWLVLDEHGEWNREMDPGLLLGFLFGVRWFEMDERFDYSAEGTDPDQVNGHLLVSTSNNLVGFQFGGEAIYQHKRWSITLKGKAGPYINFNSRRRDYRAHDEVFDADDPDKEIHDTDDSDVMAFIGETGMYATYYAKPNLSFRVGWDAMWVNQVALATRQVLFNDFAAVRPVNVASGAQYMGFSVGMDYHW